MPQLPESLAVMPTQTINNRSNNKMYSALQCCHRPLLLSQMRLTIDSYVHIEEQLAAAAVAPGVKHADIGPSVSGRHLWHFGHGACVRLSLGLQGKAVG